jgi:hypothetical protein
VGSCFPPRLDRKSTYEHYSVVLTYISAQTNKPKQRKKDTNKETIITTTTTNTTHYTRQKLLLCTIYIPPTFLMSIKEHTFA